LKENVLKKFPTLPHIDFVHSYSSYTKYWVFFDLIIISSILFLFLKDVTICKEDYKQTNYNLFCPNDRQIVYIYRTSASFVDATSLRQDCIAQPTLVLNQSNALATTACSFCFDKRPCVITSSFIDSNRMFNAETYRVGSRYVQEPISIGIFYQCLGNIWQIRAWYRSFYLNFYTISIISIFLK